MLGVLLVSPQEMTNNCHPWPPGVFFFCSTRSILNRPRGPKPFGGGPVGCHMLPLRTPGKRNVPAQLLERHEKFLSAHEDGVRGPFHVNLGSKSEASPHPTPPHPTPPHPTPPHPTPHAFCFVSNLGTHLEIQQTLASSSPNGPKPGSTSL